MFKMLVRKIAEMVNADDCNYLCDAIDGAWEHGQIDLMEKELLYKLLGRIC